MPIVSSGADPTNWPYEIHCPICGHECVHPERNEDLLGYEHDYGPVTRRRDPYFSFSLRGDGTRIPFWGECGHRFAIEFGFHKGNTFFRFATVEYVPVQRA